MSFVLKCCAILSASDLCAIDEGGQRARNGTAEGYDWMRLKLVLLCSLLAAIVGAGSSIAIIISVFSSLRPIMTPGLLVISTLLLPVLTVWLATLFVYRHTARRRKLQAALTTIISLLLTIAIFVLTSIYTARREPLPPQPNPPRTTT